MPRKVSREFREKFGFYRKVASMPERIRDGSIRDWIEEEAWRHGSSPKKYNGWLMDLGKVLLWDHPALKGKRDTIEAEAIFETLRKNRALKKNVLKDALKHHLDEQSSKAFTPEREERIAAMVGYLYKNRHKIRKDALEGFREEWNKGKPKEKHVSYDALKRDLTALSYAYLPVGKREAEEQHVIRSHRKDFKKANALKHQGKLEHSKVMEVCREFTEHSIEGDLERLRRETLLIGDDSRKELDSIHSQLTAALNELYALRKSEPNVHPATASATAWSEAGWPLHATIPKVNSLVYSLFELAEKKQKGAPLSLGEYSFPFDPNREDLLEFLESKYGIYPQRNETKWEYEKRKRAKAAGEIVNAWKAHLEHALATLEYEKARHSLKKRKFFHEKIKWGHPTRFDAPKGETKSLLKQGRLEAGKHLREADKHWAKYKELLENSTFLQ